MEFTPDGDGTQFYWPFTLHDGSPQHTDAGSFNALWELPAYNYMIPPSLQEVVGDTTITGLDFNILAKKEWGGLAMSGPEFTEILLHTLDLRMQGNRAPFAVGLHSDIYAEQKNSEYPGTANARERQLAIENFLTTARDRYPEVRIVTAREVLDWMEDPQPLA